MTLAEFLLARIAEDEREAHACLDQYARGDGGSKRRWLKQLAECEAKRRIVELHQSWPVLVQTTLSFDRVSSDPDSATFRASQQIQWQTQREYVERFGDEPPTAPVLAAMAEVYADHPDYREKWRP